MFQNILLAMIPIFVAIDAIGLVPMFIALTEGRDEPDKRRIIIQSLMTATALAVTFILGGKAVFGYLGIELGDFMIAGGVILFCIALTDILRPTRPHQIPDTYLGTVPLGTPLIARPALLATSLVVLDEHGMAATLIAVIANLLLAGVVFSLSSFLIRLLGVAGTKALSKVISLLLAAYAVMLIRRGLDGFGG